MSPAARPIKKNESDNKMKVLRDWEILELTPSMLQESKEQNGGRILLKDKVLQRADVLNQNGRIYPRHILEREIRNYQKFINENRALGEIDHPESSVIELKNVSHVIREAHIENGVVYGTIEVLNTPGGKIIQSLMESQIKIGISSRGVGSTKKEGDYQMVQDDYNLICFDVVSEPSTGGAFITENVTSGDLRKFFTKSDRINRILNDILQKS
jgi:hypothetical protein